MNTAGADAAAARAAGPYSQRPRARLSLSRAPDRNSRNPPTKSSSTSRRDVRECPWRGPSHDGGGACRKVRVASCRSRAAKEQTKNKNGEENNNNFARANVPTQVIILPRGRGVSESSSDGSMQGDVALLHCWFSRAKPRKSSYEVFPGVHVGAHTAELLTMVEGHGVHRVAAAHRRQLVGKRFKATSPNGGARSNDDH